MTVEPESSRVDAPTKPVLLRLMDIDPPPEIEEPYVFTWSPALERLPVFDPRRAQPKPQPKPQPSQPAPSRQPARAPVTISANEARALAVKLGRGLLEVLTGRRPARQLSAMLSQTMLAKLETLQRTGQRPAGACQLKSVRICQPSPKGIEVSAVFRRGVRCHALAARMDLQDRRWVCTHFQVG